MCSTSTCGRQWKPVAVMMMVNLGFAVVNILVKKILDGGLNHMVFVTYRLLIATMFLAPACYWERKSMPRLTTEILCYFFFSALVGQTLTQYFFLLGLKYTSTTLSCAFLNTVPVFTFLFALPFGLEKVDMRRKAGRAKVLGAVICVGGAMVLTFYKGIPLTNRHLTERNQADSINPGGETHKWVLGSIFLMAGCSLWSSWFLIQAKLCKKYPCQYSATAIMSFFGTIQSAISSMILERNVAMWVLEGRLAILGVIYAGVVGSGLCYVGMSWCVKQKGPVFTSAFIPATQVFAAMLDFSIMHEQLHLGSVLGSICVILGLYFVLWGKSGEASEKQEAQTPRKEDEDTSTQLTVTISSPTN